VHAANRPEHVAVICEGRETTYAQLHRASNATAHALLAEGLAPGARVAYLGRETEHYYEIALACAKSGTVLVPINWRLTAREVDHVLRDSAAELLFLERDFQPVADRLRPVLPKLRKVVVTDTPDSPAGGFLAWRAGHPDGDLDPGTGREDVVLQLYTSGTTGLPKGVMLAHRTFFAYIESMRAAGVDWIDWRPEDRSLICFPGLHAGGMGWFLHGFSVGLTNVVMRMFIAQEAVELIQRHQITITFAAPAMLQMMLSEHGVSRETFASLRKVTYGGSPISTALLVRCIEEMGCEFAQMYASAESGSVATCLGPAEHWPGNPKLTTAGRVCPGNDIKIIGGEGRILPAGEVGQICIKTPTSFLAYWGLPDATEQALVDGWLHMPDAGYLDEGGYLVVCDRIDDTIIVAGQNIYPVEVENAIAEHEAVREVAVVGVPDERWGQVVKAVVVREAGQTVTGRELMISLRGRIADYKIPTQYEFVAALPRNPTGKVLRRVLRETAGPPPTALPATETQ